MNDFRDQFFGEIFNEDNFHRQLSFESRVVRRVFSECGVRIPSMGRLVNLCRDETGHPEFSFDWFNSKYNRFPGTLCGRSIGFCGYTTDDAGNKRKQFIYQLVITELLNPKNNRLVRAISKALHESAVNDSNPFIFIFTIVRKRFCAHNLDLPFPVSAESPRTQWRFDNGSSPLIIEPATPLLRAIGPEWFEN
jgi:hypothetical protein